MASSIYSKSEWTLLRNQLVTRDGIVMEEDGQTYRIRLDSNHFDIRVKLPADHPRGVWDYIGQIRVDSTPYCCGVLQVGSFCYWTKPVPEKVGQQFMKLLRSLARWSYNKAILQAWFYRYRNTTEYNHPTLMKLFTSNGFKKYGREAFNPNSGNCISGFQSRVTFKEKANA